MITSLQDDNDALRQELAKYKQWHSEACDERTEARGNYAGAMAKLEIFAKAGYYIEDGAVWGPPVIQRLLKPFRLSKLFAKKSKEEPLPEKEPCSGCEMVSAMYDVDSFCSFHMEEHNQKLLTQEDP